MLKLNFCVDTCSQSLSKIKSNPWNVNWLFLIKLKVSKICILDWFSLSIGITYTRDFAFSLT